LIPLKDDNPTRSIPFVTISLIVANVAVFVWELMLPPDAYRTLVQTMGVTPSSLTHLPLEAGRLVHGGLTLFVAMFLHGSILHVAFNMLYLWIFGNNVEDVMGHGRFLIFYLACGLIASFTQVAASPLSKVPMIGASGAVSGILGAYVVLFPAARVLTLVFLVFFIRVIPVPAIILLGFWFLLQLLDAGPVAPGGVAVAAHIGGFVAGAALIAAFRRRRPRQSLF
jgi:membrane associated rhomboid family serine protease